jgi:beta-glucosidase-like glycosyl hydrolase
METDRFGSNAVVPLQDLLQTFLPPFKRCVTAGKPAQIMCRFVTPCTLPRREMHTDSHMSSYNAINGTPACLHPLLADPVRSQWGFSGLIVSDQVRIVQVARPPHTRTRTLNASPNARALTLTSTLPRRRLRPSPSDRDRDQDTIAEAFKEMSHQKKFSVYNMTQVGK